jgi:hypothetical protein
VSTAAKYGKEEPLTSDSVDWVWTLQTSTSPSRLHPDLELRCTVWYAPV